MRSDQYRHSRRRLVTEAKGYRAMLRDTECDETIDRLTVCQMLMRQTRVLRGLSPRSAARQEQATHATLRSMGYRGF